jgi:hypothetical protein
MIDDLPMNQISDELLMRFVDGDLSPDEQSMLAAELARNPALAARLEAFRFTREELAGAFAAALRISEPLIQKLPAAEVLLALPSPKPRDVARSLVERPSLRREIMALAAALLLLAGAAAWLLRDSLDRESAGVLAPPTLNQALEETPSGVPAKLAGDLSIKVISTFTSRQNGFCREYLILYASGADASALACRGSDGGWRVLAEDNATGPSQPDSSNSYEPAGAKARQNRRGPVADYRDSIMGADLTAEEEQEVIKRHWQR